MPVVECERTLQPAETWSTKTTTKVREQQASTVKVHTMFTVAQRHACTVNVKQACTNNVKQACAINLKQANKTYETFRGNLICIVKHSPFPVDLTTPILLSSTTCATALQKQALCSWQKWPGYCNIAKCRLFGTHNPNKKQQSVSLAAIFSSTSDLLPAHFTGPIAYAEAARGWWVTKANSETSIAQFIITQGYPHLPTQKSPSPLSKSFHPSFRQLAQQWEMCNTVTGGCDSTHSPTGAPGRTQSFQKSANVSPQHQRWLPPSDHIISSTFPLSVTTMHCSVPA